MINPSAAHLKFEDLSIGFAGELIWSVTEAEIDKFASLSGDHNPLHVDKAFASNKGFPDRVAHGLLVGAKVSALCGMVVPGRDCLLLEMQIAWPAPVFPGDQVRVRGEVVELAEDQRILRLKIRASKQNGSKSITVGRGMVLCQVRS